MGSRSRGATRDSGRAKWPNIRSVCELDARLCRGRGRNQWKRSRAPLVTVPKKKYVNSRPRRDRSGRPFHSRDELSAAFADTAAMGDRQWTSPCYDDRVTRRDGSLVIGKSVPPSRWTER